MSSRPIGATKTVLLLPLSSPIPARLSHLLFSLSALFGVLTQGIILGIHKTRIFTKYFKRDHALGCVGKLFLLTNGGFSRNSLKGKCQLAWQCYDNIFVYDDVYLADINQGETIITSIKTVTIDTSALA